MKTVDLNALFPTSFSASVAADLVENYSLKRTKNMNLYQDELTGFVMKNSRRYVQSKKLNLESLGIPGRFLTAKEIQTLAGVSRGHAYRIIANPDKHLSDQVRELLTIKVLGQIPGWQPGWKFDRGGITTPDGNSLTCDQLQNFAFVQQLLSHWETLARDQESELKAREERIQQLENRLKLPRELRLYVNDSLKQRRKLAIKPRLKEIAS